MRDSSILAVALGYLLGEVKALSRRDRGRITQEEIVDIVEHVEWMLYVQLPSTDTDTGRAGREI